jgi:hypothetical protein
MGSNDNAPAAGPDAPGPAGTHEDLSFLRGSDPVQLAVAAKGLSVAVANVAAVVRQLRVLAGNLAVDRDNRPAQQAIVLLETSAGELDTTRAGLDDWARTLRDRAGIQTAVSGGGAQPPSGGTTGKPNSVADALRTFAPAIQGLVGTGAGTAQLRQPQLQQTQQPFLPHTFMFGSEIQRLSLNRQAVEAFVKKLGLEDNVTALVNALAPATTAAQAKAILERAGAELLQESVAERTGQTVDPQQLGHWATVLMGEAALRWAQRNSVDAVAVEDLLKTLYMAGRGRSLVE